MAFDVEPTRVGRGRPQLQVVLVLVAAVALVAVAVVTSSGPNQADAPVPPSELALATRSSPAASPSPRRNDSNPGLLAPPVEPTPTPPNAAGAGGPRRLPPVVACHGLGADACRRIALAGIAALPPDSPRVTRVEAWASMLCADDLECPRDRLFESVPLGSAIVTFADGGPQAWLNVVSPAVPSASAEQTGGASAWVVRWQP